MIIIFILGGHVFHQNCLRSWLEQDTTCPICRLSLQEETTQQTPPTNPIPPQTAPNFLLWPSLTLARFATNVHGIPDAPVQRPPRNHLFRFDGSRYSSWLPSFSIEINHNFPFRLETNVDVSNRLALILIQPLDRERIDSYNCTLQVTDTAEHIEQLHIMIIVDDVNDQSPM